MFYFESVPRGVSPTELLKADRPNDDTRNMAAFKNRKAVKRIAERHCEWCGWSSGRRHCCHIVDEVKGHPEWNAISLCPNCHYVFEEKVRPLLYRALLEYGATGLPHSWSKDNKLSVISVPRA
jgi:hypothetical protein